MKNLLNLEGVKALSKMEQKNVFGGDKYPSCADLYPGGNGCEFPISRCVLYCEEYF